MGKASKWFRNLLGMKKPDPNPKPQPKKKWSFAKSTKEKPAGENDDVRHAAAVSVATSAVAEAVKLSGNGVGVRTAASVSRRGAGYGRADSAAVMIQSHFRAYLSRRALRALKALVKLQALVRGHLVRKQTADVLRRMQALLRAQARARVGRALISESPLSSMKSSHFNYPGPPTPEKFEHVIRARSAKHEHLMSLKRNGSKSGTNSWTDEKLDKILEIDTGKPHITPRQRRTLFHASNLSLNLDQSCRSFSTSQNSTAHLTVPSPSSCEVQSLSPLKFAHNIDESEFLTADNSPQFYSASSIGGNSKRESFTPTKSDGSRSILSGYSDNPSYMAYTESSKAKARSLSAPKQRPQYERSSSTKRYSVHGYGDNKRVAVLQANFANKAYPGSGRLDRLGMPARGGDMIGFSGGNWHRY